MALTPAPLPEGEGFFLATRRQIQRPLRRSEPAQQIPTHSGIPAPVSESPAAVPTYDKSAPLPQVGACAADSDAQRHSRHPRRNRLRRFQPTAHSTTAPVGRNLRSRFRRTAVFPAPASESPAAVPTYGTFNDRSRRSEPAQQIPTHSRISGTVSESPAAVPAYAANQHRSRRSEPRSRFRRTAVFRAPCRNRLRRFQPTQQISTAPTGRNLRSRFRRTGTFCLNI